MGMTWWLTFLGAEQEPLKISSRPYSSLPFPSHPGAWWAKSLLAGVPWKLKFSPPNDCHKFFHEFSSAHNLLPRHPNILRGVRWILGSKVSHRVAYILLPDISTSLLASCPPVRYLLGYTREWGPSRILQCSPALLLHLPYAWRGSYFQWNWLG